MLARLDRNRSVDGIDAAEPQTQFADPRQPLQDCLAAEVAQIQMDVAARKPASLVHLGLDCPRYEVSRCEFQHVGGIMLHKPLGLTIQQLTAFAPSSFGDEDVRRKQRGRMKLHEFQVLDRQAGLIRAMPMPLPVLISALVELRKILP